MSLTPQPIPGSVPGVQTYTQIVLQNTLTGMADATFVDALLVTVPNVTCVGALHLELVGGLGDGDSSHACRAEVAISRIAGAATLAAIGMDDFAVATTGVTANAAVTVGVTAMVGAVGAAQTFKIQVKVTKSAGASANHKAMVIAKVLDPVSAGITCGTP